MKFYKFTPTFLLIAVLGVITSVFAVVTAYDFPTGLDGQQQIKWKAILDLFVQKTGDTLTGDLGVTGGNVKINTAGKGLVVESGSVSSRGTGGQFDLTLGSILLTNSAVTANTRITFTRATGNVAVPLVYATNCVGLGIRIIGAETNTFNFLQFEEQ